MSRKINKLGYLYIQENSYNMVKVVDKLKDIVMKKTSSDEIRKLEKVSMEYNKKVDDGLFQSRGYNLLTIESEGRVLVSYNA